jgi:excisionase family DNA binding protein
MADCSYRPGGTRRTPRETDQKMDKELYTQREAAQRLRINPKALRRLVREGRLPELRLGPRLPRYRAQDLNALLVNS